MPLKKSSSHPRVRRCGQCNKVGHNKTRCPERSTVAAHASPATARGVHVYIHHVREAPPSSTHVVDLKPERQAVWQHIAPVSHSTAKPTAYHTYHMQPTAAAQQPPVLPPPPPETADYFPPLPLAQDRTLTKTAPELSLPAPRSTQRNFLASRKQRIIQRVRKASSAVGQNFSDYVLKPAERSGEFGLKSLSTAGARFKRALRTRPRAVAGTLMLLLLASAVPGPVRSYYHELQLTKAIATDQGTQAFSAMGQSLLGLLTTNPTAAEEHLLTALMRFNETLRALERHRWLEKIVSAIPLLSDHVMSREAAVQAGRELALANTYALKAWHETRERPELPLVEKLTIISDHLRAALPHYQQVTAHLSAVKPEFLPSELQGAFAEIKVLLTTFTHDLELLTSSTDTVLEILGASGRRRYLIMFQNPHEIRPTGGFMGTYALLEIKDGAIVSLDIPPGGIYDVQGQLYTYVEPPGPLQYLKTPRWEMRNANWFPDFPASAEKIMWFYRKSRHISTDGVIAINAPMLEKVLGVLGPITDTQRGVTLSAQDVLPTIQAIVEEGPEKSAQRPKQIITDLAPRLLAQARALPPEQLATLAAIFHEGLQTKDIQAFFTESRAQELADSFGWSGKITPTRANEDYLLVVNANIRGEKSDARITQHIEHQVEAADDGSLRATVVITRTHSGNPEEKFYGAVNADYLRVYVPRGSQLIAASGFGWPDEDWVTVPVEYATPDPLLTALETPVGTHEPSGTRITNEFGKTSFGNWVLTPPGATTRVSFTYHLPFTTHDLQPDEQTPPRWYDGLRAAWEKIIPDRQLYRYRLTAQRQSGSPSTLSSRMVFPTSFTALSGSDPSLAVASNGAEMAARDFSHDLRYGVLLEKDQ